MTFIRALSIIVNTVRWFLILLFKPISTPLIRCRRYEVRIRISAGINELGGDKVLFQNYFGAYQKETTNSEAKK